MAAAAAVHIKVNSFSTWRFHVT